MRTSVAKACMGASALLSLIPFSPAAIAQLPVVQNSDKPSLAPLLREVTPAVVNIAVAGTRRAEHNPLLDDPFFRRFFDIPDQPDEVPQQNLGSGVIVDADSGYILTNFHLVEHADEITVTLADRRQLKARVLGSDEGTDIAVLEVDAEGLIAIELGDSDDLEVGDFVVAIGNPFGLGQSVTSGIVSALGRAGLGIEGYEDFIQTDASINPGNSGGALVDLDGKLVGINAAILSAAGGNIGIGFAIPTNMARAVMEQLVEYGAVNRGRLGITIDDLTPDVADALDVDADAGAVVTSVEPGSAAEAAGLAAGDVITALNGRAIRGSTDLRNRVALMRVGDTALITALRDGRSREFPAEIAATAEAPATRGQRAEITDRLAGAQFEDFRDGGRRGVRVVTVATDSPAWAYGLRPDDVILAVNRRLVTSLEELEQAVRDAPSVLVLNVLRGSAEILIVIQ